MATTKYVWVGDNVLYETDGADAVTVTYTYAPEGYGNLLSEQRGGVTYTHHYDAQGSTLALTDDTGAVTDTFRYTAWGEEVVRTGTTPTPFRWIGEKGYAWNESAGRYDVRRRAYSPQSGRWLTADPLGFIDSANRYSYVSNRALSHIDPSGLEAAPALWPCCDKRWRYARIRVAKNNAIAPTSVQSAIAKANDIWKQCCIQFKQVGEVGKTQEEVIAVAQPMNANPDEGKIPVDDPSRVHPSEMELTSGQDPSEDAIYVYFVSKIYEVEYDAANKRYQNQKRILGRSWPEAFPGYSYPRPPANAVAVESYPTVQESTLAHEFGHILSLPHVDEQKNLMFRNDARGTELTRAQCRTARDLLPNA